MRNLTCVVNLEQLSLVNNPCVLARSPWKQYPYTAEKNVHINAMRFFPSEFNISQMILFSGKSLYVGLLSDLNNKLFLLHHMCIQGWFDPSVRILEAGCSTELKLSVKYNV